MSVTRLGRVVILSFLVALACAAQSFAGVTGNISGHVIDDQGRPIGDAKVTVTSPSQSISRLTDPSGFFSILNLAPDTYVVTASKDGFDSGTVYGVTVQADQNAAANIALHPIAKTLGKIVTTATASVVSRTVTGDLYSVNAAAINSYQGSAGGAETLYSQNGVVGSLPGVVRSVGSGGGYSGNGTLSFRGGSNDQVGFELEGIPLNRGFDSANATSFVTNGLASLEVYTGGEPADSGRSMSGFVNEIIRRGTYPGGGDFTGVVGGPSFNHTVQADVYGGTPDRKFTYYVSTLASNAAYSFVNRSNLDNTSINLPANDPGCGAFNSIIAANTNDPTPVTIDCSVPHTFNVPISQAAWQSFVNPFSATRDTVGNIHWTLDHNGLQDDLQALFVVGGTETPFLYAGPHMDPTLYFQGQGGTVDATGRLQWPIGTPYIGALNQQYNPAAFGLYTWPSAQGSTGGIPDWYDDSQTTESSIEKLSYTRSLTPSSFLRVYAYALYSTWNFDQATNGFLGDAFYQLHDHATGYTASYQNQINRQNLLRLDADYSKDLTLRYYLASNFFDQGGVTCGSLSTNTLAACKPGDNVAFIGRPFAYWNDLGPINSDVAIADTLKPNDKWLFDLGARFDQFKVPLHPLQITGPNGLAEQAQNQFGVCLHGYAYASTEPCFGFLTSLQSSNTPGLPNEGPGGANWTDVSGSLNYNEFSPRFGVTYTMSPLQVLRFSVGRYVEPPATAYEEYIAAPIFGAGDTVGILNNFYDPLGFLAVHNVLPQDSTNYDLSYEQDFTRGISLKVTPFFRNTRGQILNLPVNPLQPTFVTGYNFGAARIKGSEFQLRANRTGANGLSAVVAGTYTDSKIRFEGSLGGQNVIDVINPSITAYNNYYGTSYPLLDPKGYYSPSISQSPTSTGSSYDVRWVFNVNLDEHVNGWDIAPSFNYQSGNPYGDPQNFPDAHCPGPPGTLGMPSGCTPLPIVKGLQLLAPLGGNGPDPYTNAFDSIGSLKGPSWLTMNLGIAHDLAKNVKASMLFTNVFTVVHNHGYPWEFPSKDQILSYGDNSFYNSTPLGLSTLSGVPTVQGYYGDNYYPYTPEGMMPAHEFVFSLSTKL